MATWPVSARFITEMFTRPIEFSAFSDIYPHLSFSQEAISQQSRRCIEERGEGCRYTQRGIQVGRSGFGRDTAGVEEVEEGWPVGIVRHSCSSLDLPSHISCFHRKSSKTKPKKSKSSSSSSSESSSSSSSDSDSSCMFRHPIVYALALRLSNTASASSSSSDSDSSSSSSSGKKKAAGKSSSRMRNRID